MPFAALPDPAGPGGANWRPLIAAHEVTSLPPLSVLATIRREQAGRRPAAKRAVVLADTVFKETNRRVRDNIYSPSDTVDSDLSDKAITLLGVL